MREYLQKAVDFVDGQINQPLNLDQIAGHVGFSKFYLNHMFSIYTGYSVMEYVRRKKLEYAIGELKTNKRVIDIALEVGYSSERAFSRAVVNAYGHSPAYFRTHDILKTRNLVIYDLKLEADEERILSGFPSSFKTVKENIQEKGVKLMKQYLSDVRYETIESLLVLSGTAIGNEPEDAIIDTMNRLAKTYGIEVLRQFGFDSPVEGSEDVTQLRGYEYWLAIDEKILGKLPNPERFIFEGTEISIKHIPAYRYASLRIDDPMVDPFERIGSGWQFLVSWLEDHDFKAGDFQRCESANCLEEVTQIGDRLVMDIYIPVDKK